MHKWDWFNMVAKALVSKSKNAGSIPASLNSVCQITSPLKAMTEITDPSETDDDRGCFTLNKL